MTRTPSDPPAGPIDPALVAAYRATDYAVTAPDCEIVLRAGAASDALAALMRALRVDTAAVLTAHNPWSRPTPAADNDAAQRALEAELAAYGVPTLPAEGRGTGGDWPPEPSVLALGLSRAAADSLARRWRQNAYLWVPRPGADCALVFLRPAGDDAGGGRGDPGRT
jgi:hypothetical protein